MILLIFGCKTSPPSAPVDTAPTASISSPTTNEVCRMIDTIFVDANDDLGVTKVELYINGQLVGTDNSAPWRFIWDTEQWDDGNYSVYAIAYDASQHTGTSPAVAVKIKNEFPVTFINTVYTPVTITILSATLTAQPGDSAVFYLSTNPRSLVFTASTSGKTSSGTQIGLLIGWGGTSNPVNVSTYTSVRLSLQASSTYFFMYMTNTGQTTLGPIYVNYGLTDQTRDNVAVPGDGVMYSIGYYKAHSNTVVRAYWSYPTTSYSYWNPSFSFTVNQSLNFTNTFPTSKIVSGNSANPVSAPGIAKIQIAAASRVANFDAASHGNTFVIPSID
jgi:hypothetical protein